ncbi:MAG TPA: recombination mediator RecR [Solirubrobacteraceae bacterium]|nr:recombination mediator RecR [Solirubrobacteraceae bacterium]
MSTSYAPPVQRLVTELSKLPGIGSRTAQRLAFHILRSSAEDASALARAIVEVKEKIGLCEVCFNLTDEPRCRICEDPRRDHGLICVVEEPSDVIPMERTHEYHGVYHVLGGALSPIDGVDPEDLRLSELFARATPRGDAPADRGAGPDAPGGRGAGQDAAGGRDAGQDAPGGPAAGPDAAGAGGNGAGADVGARVREVVLATNPTTTGEATALHIAEQLRVRAPELKVTRLASGLPVGSDLEYADEVTLGKALAGRRAL